MESGISGRARAWWMGAALTGVVMAIAVAVPTSAHIAEVKGSTAVDPGSGARGTTVRVSAAGASVEGGYGHGVLFADPSYTQSFRRGMSGQHGDTDDQLCAHGQPIAGPYTPDANGNIGPVEATVPQWSSPGTALVCFSDGYHVTAPVEFEVAG